MRPLLVLLHSPLVGPLTWAPVAHQLRDRGHDVLVPSLLPVAAAPVPYWTAVASLVCEALTGHDLAKPVALVAHSNAGLFVPVVAQALTRSLAGTVFVDASLPARDGPTPVLDRPDFLDRLHALADDDGVLPRWTDWFEEADVARMFADDRSRAEVTDEQPRLPLAYFDQRVPNPSGWAGRPCGYVLFGEAYDDVARDAADRGWPVERLDGGHLHQLVDPGAVTEALVGMLERTGISAD